ncbi:MAG: DUF5615 family PIN-like protein [Phycisphaerales bacterium]|nr:DUF5615 family PIN-like protein [Phycisphaerales bacterium]
MQFLIDADLPRTLVSLFASFGHDAIDVRDIGMGASLDDAIAQYAAEHHLCLITGDWGFADIRTYPPEQLFGIIIIGLPDGARGSQIIELVELLLNLPEILAMVPGRLAIVEKGRIRLRPPARE